MYKKFSILLEKTNKTAYQVSKDTGIAQSVLSDWKRGISKPKTEKLKILADYFGVTIEYFLQNEEVEKKKPTLNKMRREHGLDPIKGGDVVFTKA